MPSYVSTSGDPSPSFEPTGSSSARDRDRDGSESPSQPPQHAHNTGGGRAPLQSEVPALVRLMRTAEDAAHSRLAGDAMRAVRVALARQGVLSPFNGEVVSAFVEVCVYVEIGVRGWGWGYGWGWWVGFAGGWGLWVGGVGGWGWVRWVGFGLWSLWVDEVLRRRP